MNPEDSTKAGHHDHDAHTGHEDHSMEHSEERAAAGARDAHAEHSGDHGDHTSHVDHTGHEAMFRRRFWVSLVLSISVLLYSEMIQGWLNFSMPAFPGSQWITPVFSVVVFLYGGLPFLNMARPEVKNRRPGMMMGCN